MQALVALLHVGLPDHKGTAQAAYALGNLVVDGHGAAVVEAGGVEALMAVLRAGKPEQEVGAGPSNHSEYCTHVIPYTPSAHVHPCFPRFPQVPPCLPPSSI